MRWVLAAATGLAALLTLPATDAMATDACAIPADDPLATISRTDHGPSGNRVVYGCGPLAGETVDVDLGAVPAWVLPDPSDRGESWLVVLEDGSVDQVLAEPGDVPLVSQSPTPALEPGVPPLALAVSEEQLFVGSALDAGGWFEDPIPGARVVEAPGAVLVALSGPTDRYAHGVLGDDLEASALTLRDDDGVTTTVEVRGDAVIEGLSPIVADLDGDSVPEMVVTLSTSEHGAGLVAYDLEGELVAASAPIGQGYRWLHQIGVAPLGPEGEAEVIVVRTPHIGGIVEAYRLAGDRLELVGSQSGYSSHRLGSANLDMALLADADGDGRLDVIVPTQDMSAVAALARTGDGFKEIAVLSLDGVLATNVSASADADGHLVFAAGTRDGRLRIFR